MQCQFDNIQFGDGALTVVFADIANQSSNVFEAKQWTFSTDDHPVLVDALQALLEELVNAVGTARRDPPDMIEPRAG